MKFPMIVSWNPVLSRMPSGQLYAISGDVWIPVPDGTTRADLPKYMTWESLSKPSEAAQGRSWSVQGSRGQTYTVAAQNGAWRCTCKGYQFRRSCRHITEIKEKEQ